MEKNLNTARISSNSEIGDGEDNESLKEELPEDEAQA